MWINTRVLDDLPSRSSYMSHVIHVYLGYNVPIHRVTAEVLHVDLASHTTYLGLGMSSQTTLFTSCMAL